ncbi:hypothetical protein AgCh_021809 [Apium graveolens]
MLVLLCFFFTLPRLSSVFAQEALDELIQDYAFRAFVEVGVILGTTLLMDMLKKQQVYLVNLRKMVLSSSKLYNYKSVLPLKVVVSPDFGLDEQEEDSDGGVDERSFSPDLKIFVGKLQEMMGEQLKIGLKIVSWVESDRNLEMAK